MFNIKHINHSFKQKRNLQTLNTASFPASKQKHDKHIANKYINMFHTRHKLIKKKRQQGKTLNTAYFLAGTEGQFTKSREMEPIRRSHFRRGCRKEVWTFVLFSFTLDLFYHRWYALHRPVVLSIMCEWQSLRHSKPCPLRAKMWIRIKLFHNMYSHNKLSLVMLLLS